MGSFHYYIHDKRENVNWSGEQTDLYLVHEFHDEDFSSVVHPKKVPSYKMPDKFEVGDLIETEERVFATKLEQAATSYASADLRERVEEIYADHNEKLREYADHLGVDMDVLSDTNREPGRSIPRKYFYISRREGDHYLVDRLGDTTLGSWRNRTRIPAKTLPGRFGVGDVLLAPKSLPSDFDEAEILEPARSQPADAIRDAFDELDSRVRDYADMYDIDLDERPRSLEDGDVILVAEPADSWRNVSMDEYLYVTPEGLYSDGEVMDIQFDLLVNCSKSTFESGMAFSFIEFDDEYIDAIRYDHARTQEVRDESALVHLHRGDPSKYNEIETEDDLEWPLYVLFDGFDDGQYYSSLYDSGGDENSRWPGLRELAGGSAWSPRQVSMDWPCSHGGGPVPISELYLDEDDHPEAPVAVVSPDSDPVQN